MNDIFYFISETCIANYADDNALYAVDDTKKGLLKKLTRETESILDWFRINEMRANKDKCHLIVINAHDECIKLGNVSLTSESSVELLGVTIDDRLQFKEHVNRLIKTGNQKFHALARISKHISENKLKILMKSFILSQFNYCSLIWMYHDRTINAKLNKLHERALRMVYKDNISTFEQLLIKDNSMTIHQRNLQKLGTAMYKIKNEISPKPIQELFEYHRNRYDLRNEKIWKTRNIRTTLYGAGSMTFQGPKIWGSIPDEIKASTSTLMFKQKIKKWFPNC